MTPKKEYKKIIGNIKVINIKTEKVEKNITKTLDDQERRDWFNKTLIKTITWAMFNGHYVEVINKEDDKDEG